MDARMAAASDFLQDSGVPESQPMDFDILDLMGSRGESNTLAVNRRVHGVPVLQTSSQLPPSSNAFGGVTAGRDIPLPDSSAEDEECKEEIPRPAADDDDMDSADESEGSDT
ncbi:hypothetical protein R1sor_007902 [Riccia sorocarpa]|uniref:Uncharacterized protein n=1 Tax=Riccia sorocarpa TaxID=122646 RepID=A0ABD3HTZ3_9MARC